MKSQDLYLPYFISIGLTVSFILSLTGSFFPPQSTEQTIFFRIDALFAITAYTCLSSKAGSEKFDIPCAGFTVLAIAQGFFISEIDNAHNWNFGSANTGVLFMIPAVIMIAFYTLFPKWLRIGGIISIVPFLILLGLRTFTGTENTTVLENIIFLFHQIITLCWAWQIWKNRKEIVDS